MITKSWTFSAGLLIAGLLLIGGCADKAAVDNVDKRSVERWNFLIAHQAEKAYDYTTPGFRSTQTREAYAASMNGRPVRWKSATFNRKECESDRCKVHVDVAYSLAMPGVPGKPIETSSTQIETWILVDGAWYFLPN